MPLTNESMKGGGSGAPSPATLGYQAAVAGEPRTSPYDGRSRMHKEWMDGYDSHRKPAPPEPEPEPTKEEPMPLRDDEVYVARESGASLVGGETHTFTKGVTRVRRGHPLLDAVPDYFEPIDRSVHYDIEDATADPGRRRGEQ